jgi:hypothetical protein
MQKAAGTDNGNENYEGDDERAEGFDKKGLHGIVMILEARAKKGRERRRGNQNNEVREVRNLRAARESRPSYGSRRL